jgi:hypothetical protein
MRARLRVAGLLLAAAAAAPVHADGLADMKAALQRVDAVAPVKGTLEARTWRRTGEGKEAIEVSGLASVGVEDGPRGLSILYGKDLLARLELEKRARVKDPDAKAPLSNALEEVSPGNAIGYLSAAPALLRMLEKAVPKGERADTWQGKPVRVLKFEIPMSTLPKEALKYTKKFDASTEIWIGADGMPLASRMRQTMSGRAFVVISFEATVDESVNYALVGDRLVQARRESRRMSAGAGEKQENRNTYTLQLAP